jgi:hypothetical protein
MSGVLDSLLAHFAATSKSAEKLLTP